MVCLSRPYPFKFIKGCLPKILLGPFLNALSQIEFYLKLLLHFFFFLFAILVLLILLKVSKYGVSSDPYFPVSGQEKTPYLDTFHAVITNVKQTGKRLPDHKLEYYFFLINNV